MRADAHYAGAAPWFSITPRELRFGPGSLDQVAGAVAESGVQRPLVLTDPGVRAAGWPDLIVGRLGEAGIAAAVWDGVRTNPDEAVVDGCRDVAQAGGHDGLLAVGGGSTIDTAKACSGLIGNGGALSDHEGLGRLTKAGPVVLAVPTTPGTGAETSRHAVITASAGRKFAVSGPWLSPVAIIADPRLSRTAPSDVIVDAAIDALLHAIEAFLARAATPLSDVFAREAVSRITRSAVAAVSGDDRALSELAFGCLLGGFAMSSANAGIVHALGYPLSSEHGITHARANAAVAPAALGWLRAAGVRRQDQLLRCWGLPSGRESAPSLGAALEELCHELGASTGLEALGLRPFQLGGLARRAMDYGPVLRNTPVVVSESDLLAVYQAAWPSPLVLEGVP